MYVMDLFSYKANLDKMLSQIGKRLDIEFFCDIDLYEGIVMTNTIHIDTMVSSLADIEEAFNGNADYYNNSDPTFELSDDIISEAMEVLEFAKIDTTKPSPGFNSTRSDHILLIDDDTVSINCVFSLGIVDI